MPAVENASEIALPPRSNGDENNGGSSMAITHPKSTGIENESDTDTAILQQSQSQETQFQETQFQNGQDILADYDEVTKDIQVKFHFNASKKI